MACLFLSATGLTVFAGLGVMLSLMEGFRRAYELPRDDWGFWERRLRALLLVPIALLPLWLASLLLVFGHQIEVWMVSNSDHELRLVVIVFWRMVRWATAVLASVSVLSALYHFGHAAARSIGRGLCPARLLRRLCGFRPRWPFGWYVTRVADYSRFYGPFAAGIATLVWLYLTSFSALVGAELNGVLYHGRRERLANAAEAESSPALTSL